MNTLLDVRGVKTDFITAGKRVEAVTDATFRLGRGEIIGVVGESGSGKSVTMMSILQLVGAPGRVAGGEVLLDGEEGNLLDHPPDGDAMRAVRGGRVGIIFQEPMTSLNPVLTIGYQISESIMLHSGLNREEARRKAIEMLELVRIPDAAQRYDYYPQQFSGGMRQRIMIAIALAADPDVLIADEATTALDVTIQAQLLEMLRDIAATRGVSIIIVTHNMGIVARYAARIYVMYSGSVVESADTVSLFTDPQHPYTVGLLRAIPRLTDPKDRVLVPIDGLLPDASRREPRCQFYDRCMNRAPRCAELPPPALQETGQGHLVACHLGVEERARKQRELAEQTPSAPPAKRLGEVCLEVVDLTKTFPVRRGLFQKVVGTVSAIDGVSFAVRRGETLGIVGESGCGKSTLARCVIRAQRPDRGSVLFEGRDIAPLRERELRDIRSQVAMVFQDPFSSLDPRQTAGSIVGESLKIHGLARDRAAYERRVDELFRLVELDPSLKHRVPHEFSGGQRQRLGIARALSSNPSLIVCDEPISALDVSVQAQIINLLERLQAELQISYLFIAHDLAVVRHISDRVLVMYLGHVVEIADCEALYSNPLHPYTRVLLSAVPTADPVAEREREILALRGEIASVTNRPPGCCFSTRCELDDERCRAERPVLRDCGGGHLAACHQL